jgi:hypothetical protein
VRQAQATPNLAPGASRGVGEKGVRLYFRQTPRLAPGAITLLNTLTYSPPYERNKNDDAIRFGDQKLAISYPGYRADPAIDRPARAGI